MRSTDDYIKEVLTKNADVDDTRLVVNVWFAKVRDHHPEHLDAAYAFCKLLSDGDVEMPQDILDRRNELLIDVKNW